ncbi:MAG: 23S rRNA (uracil(1939)-C(5))-methyltransferase RlmD [Mycoplasmatales bacterium]
MEINEIIKNIEITDYTHEGLGITHVNDQVIFVYQGIKDEILNIQIIKQHKKIYYAKIIDIVTPSKNRVNLENIKVLPGCDLQHMSYEEQLRFKETSFKTTLQKNKLDIKVSTIIAAPDKLRYRNKITFSFFKKQNILYLGMKKEKTNQIIKIENCYLISKEMNSVKDEILKQLNLLNHKVENNLKLRQLIIKENTKNEYLIIIETDLNSIDIFSNYFEQNKIAKIKALYIKNKNNKLKDIYQQKFIQGLNELSFIISPNAFFQVNTKQTLNLYEAVVQQITKSNSILLDAYCGSGTIGQYVSKKVEKVVGIEVNQEAIKDAKANAKLNKITNCEYIQGDINKEIATIYQKYNNYFDIVVVDPPRKGIAKKFIQILNEFKPEEIIYISCQPSTLVRDLKLLQDNYTITFMQQYDMFPQTHHVETVVSLSRRNK